MIFFKILIYILNLILNLTSLSKLDNNIFYKFDKYQKYQK